MIEHVSEPRGRVDERIVEAIAAGHPVERRADPRARARDPIGRAIMTVIDNTGRKRPLESLSVVYQWW
ncbi:MAG: hypothetical protein IT378_21560 [Sandaracinaceae bacterium]|nr:hypothetical protein [Sandaracinaceae bacterium]